MAKRDKDIINKSVTFDRIDPDQKADLLHAEKRSNFSAYVRMLIHMDRIGQYEPAIKQPVDRPAENKIDEEDVKGFL